LAQMSAAPGLTLHEATVLIGAADDVGRDPGRRRLSGARQARPPGEHPVDGAAYAR
jgi:hypothetical protein